MSSLELSRAATKMDYTPAGSYEISETCSVCEDIIIIGTQILRHTKSKKPICPKCAIEISKIV